MLTYYVNSYLYFVETTSHVQYDIDICHLLLIGIVRMIYLGGAFRCSIPNFDWNLTYRSLQLTRKNEELFGLRWLILTRSLSKNCLSLLKTNAFLLFACCYCTCLILIQRQLFLLLKRKTKFIVAGYIFVITKCAHNE